MPGFLKGFFSLPLKKNIFPDGKNKLRRGGRRAAHFSFWQGHVSGWRRHYFLKKSLGQFYGHGAESKVNTGIFRRQAPAAKKKKGACKGALQFIKIS
ncbi:MAG: hypothetical protein K8R48_06600 [Alphaproteobacteria bacterium]|nr:hypothetical protein [Alphaproteobacteria bacterium]